MYEVDRGLRVSEVIATRMPTHSLVGDLVVKAPASQKCERLGSPPIIGGGDPPLREPRRGPLDLLGRTLLGERGLDQILGDPAPCQRALNPVGAPAGELTLIGGESVREAAVVQLPTLRQMPDHGTDLVVSNPPRGQPPLELDHRALLSGERSQSEAERLLLSVCGG